MKSLNVIVTIAAATIACTAIVPAQAALITDTNLQSIRFIEFTGGPSTFSFNRLSSEMSNRLNNPLGGTNRDFIGNSIEYYDVFYSNANGTFNLNGDYVTVEAQYSNSTGGGGLNIGAIFLDFAVGPSLQANILTSFQGLGANYIAGSELNAVDAAINTATIMGSTAPGTTERLRITVGFRPTAVSEPGSLALLGLGLVGVGLARRRAPNRG